MASSSSVSRYKPIIIGTAIVAAAFGVYLIYESTQSPTDLHRRNAIRRTNRSNNGRRAPRYPDGGVAGIENRIREIPQSNTVYGIATYHGHILPLTLDNMHPLEIRRQITNIPRDFTVRDWEGLVAEVQEDFLRYFLQDVFSERPLSHQEWAAVQSWLETFLREDVVARGINHFLSSQRQGREDGPSPETTQPQVLVDGAMPIDSDGAETVAITEPYHSARRGVEDEGQILQSAVYYIAEDRSKQEGIIHRGIACDQCEKKPIRGIRWRCANCPDFDLCSYCEAASSHDKTHIFYKVRIPAPYLGYPREQHPLPILYPGKPEMMQSSLDPKLRGALINSTKMPQEEIDGLYEQFTCIANTPWREDRDAIGWAINREAFDKAFLPHYSHSTTGPSLVYDRLFSFFDSNVDELIGFRELIDGLSKLRSRDYQARLRVAFNGYDIDEDGLITRRDMLRLFRSFFATQREHTKDYIAVKTSQLETAGVLDRINSSQPLSAHFHDMPLPVSTRDSPDHIKARNNFGDSTDDEPVLYDRSGGNVERNEFLRQEASQREMFLKWQETERERQLRKEEVSRELEVPKHLRPEARNPTAFLRERWARRAFYIDEEEGFEPPLHSQEKEEHSAFPGTDSELDGMSSSNGLNGVASDSLSKSSSPSQPSNRSSETTVARGHVVSDFPTPEKDLGRDLLYQITQQGFNELLDPLFKEKEDLAVETLATADERKKWEDLIEKHMGAPVGSLDRIAMLAYQLGDGQFQNDYQRVLYKFTYKHKETYLELGPKQACAAYLEDAKDADRELLHENVERSDEGKKLPTEAELLHAVEVRHSIISKIWTDIEKDLFNASGPPEESVLDPNIVRQPLEDLLGQSGYAVADEEVAAQSTAPSGVPALDHGLIGAHYADARSRMRDMAPRLPQPTQQEPAMTEHADPRDPTMPQFRPNRIDDDEHTSPPSHAFSPALAPATSVAEPTPTAPAVAGPPTPPHPIQILPHMYVSSRLPIPKAYIAHLPPAARAPPDTAHLSYMNAAKHYKPSLDHAEERIPPPERLDRLVLLEKHEQEMRERGGAGMLSWEEFRDIVRRDGMGDLRYVEGWLECVSF